jgi:hypothetical protein
MKKEKALWHYHLHSVREAEGARAREQGDPAAPGSILPLEALTSLVPTPPQSKPSSSDSNGLFNWGQG